MLKQEGREERKKEIDSSDKVLLPTFGWDTSIPVTFQQILSILDLSLGLIITRNILFLQN